uniref:DUF1618 domain-containing protein n=1 Tax=Oryza glumipatula TaxID=40148 RepID=A0A0E0BPI0_9ORYZ
MKERGFSHLDGDAAISAACAGITDWEEKKAAEERAIEAESLRYRAERDAAAEAIVRRRKAAADGVTKMSFLSPGDLYERDRDILEGIDPDPPVVADVPCVSSLVFRLSSARTPADFEQATTVAGADHNVVVVGAGHGLPGHRFYLVYDAWANSLSAIPGLPSPFGAGPIGYGVAVLRHASPGDYVLANILLSYTGGDGGYLRFPTANDADLWTWWSSGPSARRWIRKPVILPPETCTATYIFHADTTFSMGGNTLCWADLLIGIVACDMLAAADEPAFRFIPLPEACSSKPTEARHHRYGGARLPEERRSMCCGGDGGVIWFVSIDDGEHPNDLTLTTWSLTMAPELKQWKQEAAFSIGDLVYSDELIKKTPPPQLPPLKAPTWPVHSIVDDDVVFLYLAEVKSIHPTSINMERYMVSVNVRRREVFAIFEYPSDGLPPPPFPPRIMPSNLSCYLNKTLCPTT